MKKPKFKDRYGGAHKNPLPVSLPPHQLGRQCPKCGRGNAPWLSTCPCGPDYKIIASNTTT